MNIWWILGLIILLLGIIFLALFGDLPSYRGTYIHTLSVHLNRIPYRLASMFHSLDDNFFNGHLSSPIVMSWSIWIGKWLVPAFYFIVMGQCLRLFFMYSFNQILHYDKETNWSFRIYFIIVPILVTNFLSFTLAIFTDPGHIKEFKSQSYQLEFPYDNILFFPNMDCSTCKTQKTARSKHCSTCDRCILMFDHHCIWLNNDVGYYNYRYFFTFLVNILLLLTYGSYLCYYSIHCFITYEKDLPLSFTSGWFFVRYWNVINHSKWENEISGILLMMATLITPVVFGFLMEHIRSIYLGVTTNEFLKWDYISELIENNLLYCYNDINGNIINRTFFVLYKANWDGSRIFVKLEDNKPFQIEYNKLQRINSWDDLTNIYDKGFWSNFKQKMFPNTL